jgi:hypothetical protein
VGFAGAEAHKNLEAAVLEIALKRDEGAGASFLDLAEEAVDFRLMEKQFAGPVRLRVGAVAVAVGGNVEGVEPGLAVFNPAEGVGEVAVTGADGLNLRAGQDDTGLD